MVLEPCKFALEHKKASLDFALKSNWIDSIAVTKLSSRLTRLRCEIFNQSTHGCSNDCFWKQFKKIITINIAVPSTILNLTNLLW